MAGEWCEEQAKFDVCDGKDIKATHTNAADEGKFKYFYSTLKIMATRVPPPLSHPLTHEPKTTTRCFQDTAYLH